MPFLAQIMIALVAIAHIGFLVLEMFLWTRPTGLRIFGISREFAEQSRALAANQGLYNGFLAAGLFWSLLPIGEPGTGKTIATFFLICVLIAGLFGAATVSGRILRVQALPAFLALAMLWLLPG